MEGFDAEANMRNSTFTSQPHRSSSSSPAPSAFPDDALPGLAQLIASRTGALGKDRIIEAFLCQHPNVAKRQVHHAIVRIGVREKRGSDTRARWCVWPCRANVLASRRVSICFWYNIIVNASYEF